MRLGCCKGQILAAHILATLINRWTCSTRFSRSRFRIIGADAGAMTSWVCSKVRAFLTQLPLSWRTWARKVRSAPRASSLFYHSYTMLSTTNASLSCNASLRAASSFYVQWYVTISSSQSKNGQTHPEVAFQPLAWSQPTSYGSSTSRSVNQPTIRRASRFRLIWQELILYTWLSTLSGIWLKRTCQLLSAWFQSSFLQRKSQESLPSSLSMAVA